jgi:hypothetical protein
MHVRVNLKWGEYGSLFFVLQATDREVFQLKLLPDFKKSVARLYNLVKKSP